MPKDQVIIADENAQAFGENNPLPVTAVSSSSGGVTSTLNTTTTPTTSYTGTGEGVSRVYEAVKFGRYFRARATFDSLPSYLRLYTYYGSFQPLNTPLNTTILADSSARIVRSVDSSLDLAFGRFEGMDEDAKFGSVQSMDAADAPFDCWEFATDTLATRSATKTWPTTASTFYIASSDNSDTQTIAVHYLDSTGAPQVANLTLTGRTPLSIGSTAIDCNRLRIGDNQAANAGAIYLATANNFTTGVPNDVNQVVAYIPVGLKQTQQAMDQVPLNYRDRIKWMHITVSRASGAAGSAILAFEIKKGSGGWTRKRTFFPTTSVPINKPMAGLVFDELVQMRLRVLSVSDADTSISGIWHRDRILVSV